MDCELSSFQHITSQRMLLEAKTSALKKRGEYALKKGNFLYQCGPIPPVTNEWIIIRFLGFIELIHR